MNRFVLTLMLLTGTVATATSVDFANQGGKIKLNSNNDLILTGSNIVSVQIGNLPAVTGDLGSVALSTGTLLSGTVQNGALFNLGGDLIITGNAANPLHNGVIFTGAFDQDVHWALITEANGTHDYTLVGTLSGTWFTGQKVSGLSVQLTVNTGKGFFNKAGVQDASGDTAFSGVSTGVVPEPSSLMYLGTGLFALAGVAKRKFLNR